MKELEETKRLKDIEEIKQLKSRYFRSMDTKDFDNLRTVFAPDAWFDSAEAVYDPILGQPEGWPIPATVHGLEEIIDMVRTALTIGQSFHMGHTPEIEINSDTTAKGIVPFEDTILIGTFSMAGYGYYHETYERINGQWRIKTSTIKRVRVKIDSM